MDISTIKTIVNLSFTILFVLIMVILFFAAIFGFKKGAFKFSYKFLFFLTCFLSAVFTLEPLCNLLYNVPIHFFGWRTLVLSREGLSYYISLEGNSLFNVTYDFLRGIFYLFNINSSPTSAHLFAITLVTLVIKIVIFHA